ncbi:regucalcin-like [Contarinia nasturtii]|uniref:regucalcin-like n=1 Tax=Contarinia nasturtii TaxID=265458 RepID=UPI0012D3D4EB|nr:regucalcin-like [Contarinia nasturtii]
MYKISVLIGIFVNFVRGYTVEPISSEKWLQAYSPYYNAETQSLYFCDFFDSKRTINRFDMTENRFYSAAIEGNISTTFIIPIDKQIDQYAISNKNSVNVVQWNGKDSIIRFLRDTFTVETGSNYELNQYNMGRASPNRNFYGGTFTLDLCIKPRTSNAALYLYTKCLGVKALERKIMVASGMDWNIKAKLFYFIDTCRYQVYEFDWNPETDEICNKRIVFDFKKNGMGQGVFPLALTIDDEGFLYVGLLFGSAVWKINPRNAQVTEIIHIPAEIVLGLVFGGKNYRTLFVTTGSTAYNFTTGGLSDGTFSQQSGLIFKVNGLNARGYPTRKIIV